MGFMRRRKIDVENLGENIQISLKLPQKVLKWIEMACEDNPGFTGRSHFIDNACRYYLNLEPCSNCGKLNPRDANVCAYCSTQLQGLHDILDKVQSYISDFENVHSLGCEINDTIDNLLNDTQNFINSLDDTIREKIDLELSGFFYRCKSRIKNPSLYFKIYHKKFPTFKTIFLNKEMIVSDYKSVLLGFIDNMNEPLDESANSEAAVLTSLYYYNLAKTLLNGDNFSLKEIDNLYESFATVLQFAIEELNTLKMSYDDLLVYQKMVKLLAEKLN